MKRSSFFTKLFIGSLVLIAIVLAIFAMVSYRYLNSDYQKQMEVDQGQAAKIMRYHFQRLWLGSSDEIDRECKTLFQDQPMRLTIIALDGTVLGDSKVDPSAMAKHLPDRYRPEIDQALKTKKTGADKRTSVTTLIEYRYLAEPITIDGKIVGFARIAMPIREIAGRSNLIRNSLLWAAMIGFGVATFLALLLSWIWFSPLRQITQAAREIASGNIDHRVSISGTQEMVQLGQALNAMASNLSKKIAEITTQQNNLNTVLDNLQEGVVAVDDRGCVVFMNASANMLFGVDESTTIGKQLQHVVRIADVITACKTAQESREPVTMQIEHNIAGATKTLDITALQLPPQLAGEIFALLVARDITAQAQTAKMKTEFVANASHELRTPLATIRLAVDSLEFPSDNDRQQFDKIRDILDRQTTQLQDLTTDLLSLHKISQAGEKPKLEPINIKNLASWTMDYLAQHATQQFSIESEIAQGHDESTELISFKSDIKLLKLILRNLIDNAIRFTPESGVIKLSLDLTLDNLMFRISDTGCGISPENQGRVFERFFQVDSAKSGSGKDRGTGLGLAIVKHASERLGGQVNLKSKPQNGTTVEINLPHTN